MALHVEKNKITLQSIFRKRDNKKFAQLRARKKLKNLWAAAKSNKKDYNLQYMNIFTNTIQFFLENAFFRTS